MFLSRSAAKPSLPVAFAIAIACCAVSIASLNRRSPHKPPPTFGGQSDYAAWSLRDAITNSTRVGHSAGRINRCSQDPREIASSI